MSSVAAFVGVTLAAGISPGKARQASAAEQIGGTWDLTWQTRKGPSRRGHMVIAQKGASLDARIHGQGSVRARGSLSGDAFELRGTRMAVSYRIAGRVSGDRMTGSLKVLSVEKHFTGTRRD